MHDDVPIERQWILFRALAGRRHGMSVGEMAHELEVAEKTIRRDLQLSSSSGSRWWKPTASAAAKPSGWRCGERAPR